MRLFEGYLIYIYIYMYERKEKLGLLCSAPFCVAVQHNGGARKSAQCVPKGTLSAFIRALLIMAFP